MPAINGKRVRALREEKGLKQYELAIHAKVDQSYLSEIERGLAGSVGSQILMGLAGVLETNVDYLIGISDDPRPPQREEVGGLKPDEEELIKSYRQLSQPIVKQYVRDHVVQMADIDRLILKARSQPHALKPQQAELAACVSSDQAG